MPDRWADITRRVAAGEDILAVLDEYDAADRADFDHYLRVELGRPDIADRHAAKLREMDLGIDGARRTWSALSAAQRRVLRHMSQGTKVWRDPGNANRFYYRADALGAVCRAGVRTIRNLCDRDLLTWDGGAFDPEAMAVATERGRFVLKHCGHLPEGWRWTGTIDDACA